MEELESGFLQRRARLVDAAQKLGNPKAFDLITDPKEEYPQTGLRSSWIAGPAMKVVVEFEQSLKKYPSIAPGTPDPYTPPK
jgi:arylsulfatase